MVQKVFLLPLFFLLFCNSLFAEIIEIQSLIEVNSHLEAKDLVALDIDDTLLESNYMVGSSQWEDFLRQKYQQEGFSKSYIDSKILTEQIKFYNKPSIELINKDLALNVYQWQKKGVSLIGICSKNIALAAPIINQLELHSISFCHDLVIESLEFEKEIYSGVVNGILFTPNENKECNLLSLIESLERKFCKIVFISTDFQVIKEIEETFNNKEVPFLGVHLIRDQKQLFDSDIANIQQKYFDTVLSNDDADLILQAQNRGL